jgi:methylmalonyl-CoA/ethylmalonyl-CoA epimerase
VIRSLDHIAIAVPELDEAVRRFVEDLGLELAGTEEVESAKTTTAFLPVRGPTSIELITPLRGEGPVASHLDKRGPGLHHICFRTDDVDADMARLQEKGWRFTTDAPTPGAHGTRVCFVHPKSSGGVLIELAQYPEDHA